MNACVGKRPGVPFILRECEQASLRTRQVYIPHFPWLGDGRNVLGGQPNGLSDHVLHAFPHSLDKCPRELCWRTGAKIGTLRYSSVDVEFLLHDQSTLREFVMLWPLYLAS